MAAEKRILICGDRDWDDVKAIAYIIQAMLPNPDNVTYDLVIIEGDARGADRIAGNVAKTLGLEPEVYPAHWSHNQKCLPDCKKMIGPPAGPIRNKQMLVEGKPEMIFAFHDNIVKSKGTANMIKQAIEAGVFVYLARHSPKGLLLQLIGKLPIKLETDESSLVKVSWLTRYNKEGIKEV